MENIPPVAKALEKAGIRYRLFRHATPPRSVEQAAQERGERPSQVVRSIVFRLAEGDYLMVLMPGERRVSWAGLRSHLGRSRLTMAEQAEVLAVTGYPVGAVAPFGLSTPMPILLDRHIFDENEVSIGSGVRGVAVILRSVDLRKALPEAEVGDYAE